MTSIVADNLQTVRQKITAAARAANRDPATIDLIAVSKMQDEASVREAMQAGHNIFGENRVQEASNKFKKLQAFHAPLKVHLIGPLQTNKTEEAVEIFDVIHTLDRINLADALARVIRKTGRKPKLYIQVNSGREPQKAGVAPEDFDIFLHYCRENCGLVIDGLMCIPPQKAEPEPYFYDLKKMADVHGLPRLSMGMSSDFEKAIACGATEVRIGTALFGERLGSTPKPVPGLD